MKTPAGHKLFRSEFSQPDILVIRDAFIDTDEPKRPRDIYVTRKGWAMLIRIKKLDPQWLPADENSIWMRAIQMRLAT